MSTDGRKPRLTLLTQWFDPEPTFKGLLFARKIAEHGFDVEAVTGYPNYPGGELYSGYRLRPILRETTDGIKITRLFLYPSHDRSALKRAANYLSFALSAFTYLIFSKRRPDVIYVYHPPLTVGIAAALAKWRTKAPLVLDIQDMWPDTLRATGMLKNKLVYALIERLCTWLYRTVDHIVVLSPGFKRLLCARGVPGQKISVIYNWADEDAISDTNQLSQSTTDGTPRFEVLFAGNMGFAQGLDTVLDTAAMVQKKNPNTVFSFLGSGVAADGLKARAALEGLTNVRFLPRVPMAEVGAYLAAADCLLVHLTKDPLFTITVPSKTQAYMAAGKPIIMAVDGDAAELVTMSGGGITIPPQNAEAMAAAVLSLAAMPREDLIAMGEKGKTFYRDRLSLTRGVAAFASVFNSSLRPRSAPV